MHKSLSSSDITKMVDHDKQMVRGRFSYKENPGGKFKFALKLGKGFPLFREIFKDGHEYTVPLGVAKWLNDKCKYPRLVPAVNEKGQEIPNTSMEIYISRVEFSIFEFITPDMMAPKDLIKVVKTGPVLPMPSPM